MQFNLQLSSSRFFRSLKHIVWEYYLNTVYLFIDKAMIVAPQITYVLRDRHFGTGESTASKDNCEEDEGGEGIDTPQTAKGRGSSRMRRWTTHEGQGEASVYQAPFKCKATGVESYTWIMLHFTILDMCVYIIITYIHTPNVVFNDDI